MQRAWFALAALSALAIPASIILAASMHRYQVVPLEGPGMSGKPYLKIDRWSGHTEYFECRTVQGTTKECQSFGGSTD